jgi:hypothetical protein
MVLTERDHKPEEIVHKEGEGGVVEETRFGATAIDEQLQLGHPRIGQTIFHL